MNWTELEVLEACEEAATRQQELLPSLGRKLEVKPEEVLYTWVLRRERCLQHGRLPDNSWAYFFHGSECDLRNTSDGRFVRLDFGPGGMADTFTAWGVLQFIMTAKTPWPEFANLKKQFALHGPPYDEFSGDLGKFGQVWDRLKQERCLEPADVGLLKILSRSTTVGGDGIARVRFPPGMSEREQADAMVAHRERISDHGRQLLESRRTASLSASGAKR